MTMFYRLFLVFTLTLLLRFTIEGFKHYQEKIPRGNSVPHPCKVNTLWQGVGHFLDGGFGLLNPFGLDFATEGYKWTKTLCNKDSDGDGKSNGVELGDPTCDWVEIGPLENTSFITHPGICDPWETQPCLQKNVTHSSYKTQGDWLRDVCKPQVLVACPAKSEPGVKNIELRIDKNTPVPLIKTTYMCQLFHLEKLIDPGDYHIVAVEPVVDNTEVLHHTVLYGCTDFQPIKSDPFECGTLPTLDCRYFLGTWAVGMSGECAHPLAGIRIGQSGYKKVAIQAHWNNQPMKSKMVDSSGLRIYYTPNLRKHDAAILVTGPQFFVLPPGRPSITVTSTCTRGCTRNLMGGPIYATLGWNHMHSTGTQMSIKLVRNNSDYIYLTNSPHYNFQSPFVYSYMERPIEIWPGDEILTTCTYSTLGRNLSTLQGHGTEDEMCLGLVAFYPKANMPEDSCLTFGLDINICESPPTLFYGCTHARLFQKPETARNTPQYQKLKKNCLLFSPCLEECLALLANLYTTDQCFQNDIFTFIKINFLHNHDAGQDMLARIASCQTEVYLYLNRNSSVVKNETSRPLHEIAQQNHWQASGATLTSSLYFSLMFAMASYVLI